MIRAFIALLFCLGLASCQPKGTYTYQYPENIEFPINNMVVVIDYLNLKDDVGKYWDFDSYYHQKTLDHLLSQVESILLQEGYPKVSAFLLSSGLLIKNEFAVEHYWQEQSKKEMLYPPYLLALSNVRKEHIEQHREFLTIMVKYLAHRRHHLSDPFSLTGMQMGYHFENLDLADDTGLFYLYINQSAPGAIKQLGALLLSGAIASQADYAHVGIDLSSNKHASAFLIHKGSGQILWKNYSNQWASDQPLSQLLTTFPTAIKK